MPLAYEVYRVARYPLGQDLRRYVTTCSMDGNVRFETIAGADGSLPDTHHVFLYTEKDFNAYLVRDSSEQAEELLQRWSHYWSVAPQWEPGQKYGSQPRTLWDHVHRIREEWDGETLHREPFFADNWNG